MNTESQISLNETNNCSICLQIMDESEKCVTNCRHIFCRDCLHGWFDRNKISCPVCRGDIKDYNNNNTMNHIVKIINEQIENQAYNRVIVELNKKIIYLRMILFMNMVYLLYSLWDMNNLSSYGSDYEQLYNNCSIHLLHCNEQQENNENYIESLTNIQEQYEVLRPLNVIIDSQMYHCIFPSYFIDKCSIFI